MAVELIFFLNDIAALRAALHISLRSSGLTALHRTVPHPLFL